MSDFASDLGAALCTGLDAVGALGSSLCSDETTQTALGYALLLVLAALMLALLTIEPAALSPFVRIAIEERAARRAPPSVKPDRTGRAR